MNFASSPNQIPRVSHLNIYLKSRESILVDRFTQPGLRTRLTRSPFDLHAGIRAFIFHLALDIIIAVWSLLVMNVLHEMIYLSATVNLNNVLWSSSIFSLIGRWRFNNYGHKLSDLRENDRACLLGDRKNYFSNWIRLNSKTTDGQVLSFSTAPNGASQWIRESKLRGTKKIQFKFLLVLMNAIFLTWGSQCFRLGCQSCRTMVTKG